MGLLAICSTRLGLQRIKRQDQFIMLFMVSIERGLLPWIEALFLDEDETTMVMVPF